MTTKSSKASNKPAIKRVMSEAGKAAQDANQVTWLLLGNLKNIRKMYLNICVLLARVRDEKLYAALHYPDMEEYAQARLNLGRSSLYNYLQIYDWASKTHPEWLDPKTKGPNLDFSDVGDLMWIEKELAQPDIPQTRQATLATLQQKAIAGTLIRSDVRKLRKPTKTVPNSLKGVISKLRLVRRRAAQLTNIPPEAIQHLDAAIKILVNESALKVAGIDSLNMQNQLWRGNFLA